MKISGRRNINDIFISLFSIFFILNKNNKFITTTIKIIKNLLNKLFILKRCIFNKEYKSAVF
jgi:hypothetical protein